MSDRINRMLIIDVDSEREDNEVKLLNVVTASHRKGPATENWDTDENLRLATEAVSMLIRLAESEGVYTKGKAIEKVVNILHEKYLKVDSEISTNTHNEFGRSNGDEKKLED